MLFDPTKFHELKNSHDLAWFLGVDHHNFKRLIRHMQANKECTVITKQNLRSSHYHPPHSNRSMQVFDLSPEQIKFLVCRQSVYWCSVFFEKIQPEPKVEDMPPDTYRPRGTMAFWELPPAVRDQVVRRIVVMLEEKMDEDDCILTTKVMSECLKYAYLPNGKIWQGDNRTPFDEMVET